MAEEWIKKKLLIRDLIENLEAHPNILQVRKKVNYLKVTFDTGISEYWALNYKGLRKVRSFLIPFNKPHFNNYQIPAYKQFEVNHVLYPEDYEILRHHFIIKKDDLSKAGWCDVRFKVHDLAVDLVEEGYIPLKYTNEVLQEEYYSLLEEDIQRYQQGLIRFSAFSYLPPSGRRLIMHFMPCAAEDLWDFNNLYRVVNRLLNRDITREEIVYYLSRPHHTARHPAFHRAIFKQWCDVKDKSVYDLYPDWGFRSLAVMAEGGEYYCEHPHMKELQELGDFIGGKVLPPILDHYDLIILSDVHPVEKDQAHSLILAYQDKADRLMISIEKDDLSEFVSRYKPSGVLRLNNDIVMSPKDDNYVLLIGD